MCVDDGGVGDGRQAAANNATAEDDFRSWLLLMTSMRKELSRSSIGVKFVLDSGVFDVDDIGDDTVDELALVDDDDDDEHSPPLLVHPSVAQTLLLL